MASECPLSFETVDQNVARLSGAVVVASVAVFLATPFKPVAALLAVDFFVRAFVSPKKSPVARALRPLTVVLGLTPKPIDLAPKKFAAGLGLVFSLTMLGLWLAGLTLPASVAASTLGFCAFLEAAFGYCLGCQVFSVIKPLLPKKPAVAAQAS